MYRSSKDGAADDHALDLTRALTDLEQLRVAVQTLDMELCAVAVAAEHLNALIADLLAPLELMSLSIAASAE